MAKKIVTLLILSLLSFGAFGQEQPSVSESDTLDVKSERLYLDIALDFDFDNTEYSGSNLGESGTLFGISLTPVLRYELNGKHNLSIGVSAQKWFGSHRFLDDIDLVAYYKFRNLRYGAIAGIFSRSELIGDYSEAIFSNEWLADSNLVQGLALQYTDNIGFAELSIDWNGLYSAATREQFRVLFSGEGHFAKAMYAGAAASIQHYANRADFNHNVVDNITINPYIGVGFNAFFDFDIRLAYLQSLQRDRISGGGWLAPMGGELSFRMSRWGLFISNNIYVGKNLQPLYNAVGAEGTIYGADLYTADPFYGTTTGIYNRTGIGYERNFWRERIKVKAEMVLKTDGKRVYTQQIVALGVNLSPKLYDKANRKSRKTRVK